jgi:P pilus assembly chaperone PapD
MSISRPWLAMATACAVFAASSSQASVVISGTRIIYTQRDREVTVRLTNDGASPALVQVWLDRGDPKADPTSINVPFMLSPPMFRIDPTKGQSLRISTRKSHCLQIVSRYSGSMCSKCRRGRNPQAPTICNWLSDHGSNCSTAPAA